MSEMMINDGDVNWEEFSDHEDGWEEDCPRDDVEDDCPLDGDAESALASCGWGTDEDYGYFGGDDGW